MSWSRGSWIRASSCNSFRRAREIKEAADSLRQECEVHLVLSGDGKSAEGEDIQESSLGGELPGLVKAALAPAPSAQGIHSLSVK